MILIADSGASKTHWVLIRQNQVIEEVYTPGFNPYYYSEETFRTTLSVEMRPRLPVEEIRKIHFYGSGVSSEANKKIVLASLTSVFRRADISVHHDLYGAAIALFGREEGIACILGTGSNSCHWDGHKIIDNVPSVGYLLGDEGSGTYMGKLLVREVLTGEAVAEIRKMFYAHNSMDFSQVLDRIYKEPEPNKFFAAQSKFLRERMYHPYCRQIINKAFEDFVQVQLSRYHGHQSLTVSFTGSVAANFQEILLEVLKKRKITLGKIMKEPMDGMIAYHLKNG